MAYKILKKLFYENRDEYERVYAQRYNSEYAHHIPFKVNESPAFFLITPEIQDMMIEIYRTDKKVHILCEELPRKSIEQFSIRCLIDEIVLTNSIEGVHSTRREINGILQNLDKNDKNARFNGLVHKYFKLYTGDKISLTDCQSIRDLYDEIVLPEVLESDPNNAPDGSIFRKESVSVQSPAQREIHRGLYPEEKIIDAMDNALQYLNDDRENLLYRTAVFHYLFGYIHPFYDGNGRLNRFISSYMIARELEPVLSYRLSYTIQENLSRYYDAFKTCNEEKNRGDLTPFLEMYLDIISKSIGSLCEALEEKVFLLEKYSEQITSLPGGNEKVCNTLYYVLIQAELFSEHGISTQELVVNLEFGKTTLKKRLAVIQKWDLLKTNTVKNTKYYGIDLHKLDDYIDWKSKQVSSQFS